MEFATIFSAFTLILAINAILFLWARSRNRRIRQRRMNDSMKRWVNLNQAAWTEADDK